MRKYLLIATEDNEMKIGLDVNAEESKNGVWKQNFRGFFVCLFRFYGVSTFVGYLMLNPFLYN